MKPNLEGCSPGADGTQSLQASLTACRAFTLLSLPSNRHKMAQHSLTRFPLGWTVSEGLSAFPQAEA